MKNDKYVRVKPLRERVDKNEREEKIMPRTYLAGVITATLLSLAAAPAMADVQPSQKTVEVDITGIDLTTDSGSDMVLKKIHRAADKACNVRSGPRPLSEIRQADACVEDAVDMLEERARQAALKADK